MTPEEREALLRRWYDPHHRALNAMTAQRLSEFGRCLIIDAHSFYPTALPYERQDAEKQRPDICIGTYGFHTPRALFESAEVHFTAAGYIVAENTPFAGALVPAAYYQRDSRVQSVMIEVNRRLYLDENAEKTAGFEPLHRCIAAWVTKLQDEK